MATDHKSTGATAGPRKGRTAANSVITAAATIAIIVGVNVIANRYFARVDLTEDHIYKLSPASKQLVKDLPDRLNVKAFISSGLQPPLNQYGNYIRDLLDEYAAASDGKFVWEAIDPLEGKDNEEKQKKHEELSKYKIQKITLERVSETKLEIGSDNYLGIAFSYGDQIEAIPQVTSTEGLEYQITGILKKLVAGKKRKIGIVTSEGELSPQQGLQLFSKVLQDYEATAVTLDKAVPSDIDALVIAGPKQPFNEKSKFWIDQYLMSGKPIAMFLDGMVIESPKGMQMPGMDQPRIGRANDLNLQDLLEKYGLKLHDDLVLDEKNTRGPVPVEGQLLLANYFTFIGIDDAQMTKGFDLTRQVQAMVMPFASSMELVGDLKEGKSGVKATVVASSSQRSWRNSGFFLFNPTVRPAPPASDADKGPFVLGYALQGKFKSAYPSGAPGSDANTSPTEPAVKESPDNVRLLVMASSGMINDQQLPIQYLPIYRQNLLFAINAVDWLIHDDSLIALRSKGMGSRPLTVVYDSKVKFWVYMEVLGIPLILITLGLVLWRARTARRMSAVV